MEFKTYIRSICTYAIGSIFGIQKSIYFNCFDSAEYSDSERAISEKMHELYPEYRLIWWIRKRYLAANSQLIPDYVEVVSDRISRFKAIGTSFCLIDNYGFRHILKRKNQIFFNTWHGDRGFKKIGGGKDTLLSKDNAKKTIILTGSDFGTRYVAEGAFHHKGEVLQVGMPRNDRLVNFDPEEALKIKERLGIDTDKKILLYAPTFRDAEGNEKEKIRIDIDSVLKALNKKTGDEWICLVRAHRRQEDMDMRGEDPTSGKIINISSYPDAQDILLITDMLISDYSSIAGDFVLRRLPIILAIFDEKDYVARSRELIAPMEETGFLLAHDEEELEEMIADLSDEDYQASFDRVYKYYGITETGHAAETVCEMIDKFYREHFKGR